MEMRQSHESERRDLGHLHLPPRETSEGRDVALSQRLTADRVNAFSERFSEIENEVRKVIVGMEQPVKLTLATIFTGGHVLLEGPPGIAKTTLARAVSTTLGLESSRIQFTPDLLPSDITGAPILTVDEEGRRDFRFRPGSVFTQVLLADELNRTPPKTQAALLEAMAEQQVTVDNVTYQLPTPFFVIATQNPHESHGVYPLAEAQLDRFAIKVQVGYPRAHELSEISRRTTGVDIPQVQALFSPEESQDQIMMMRQLVRSVTISPELENLRNILICSLHPYHEDAIELDVVTDNVAQGPSPRGVQAITLLAKAHALLENRAFVSKEDLLFAAVPTLGHRITLQLDSMWDRRRITPDRIVQEVTEAVLG